MLMWAIVRIGRSQWYLIPKGRLQFSKNGLPTGEHVVAVLDPKIDEAHLARLRRAGVSYVFQGDGAECTEREKLSAALAALEETFGVKRLLLEGGGVLNGSFLAAGLSKKFRCWSARRWTAVRRAQNSFLGRAVKSSRQLRVSG